jgi:hypothetical protein
MKNLPIMLVLAAGSLFWSNHNHKAVQDARSVNSILGDASFIEKFGRLPDGADDEDLRISTHLEYVESLLRNKNSDKLPEELRGKRKIMLDLLHEYRTAGVFPRNYDYPGMRIPCFIDREGRICAVGYLIEKTAGRQAAESVNGIYQYEKILAMNDEAVGSWIASSGLSKEECAMIQPAYGWNPPPTPPNPNRIPPAYGLASSILGGVNLSMNALNALQINNGRSGLALPVAGLITGAGSVIYGAAHFPKADANTGLANESQKALSMLNIGLGTSTIILSAWNLSKGRAKKNKTVTYHLFGIPAPDNRMAVGVGFTKQW